MDNHLHVSIEVLKKISHLVAKRSSVQEMISQILDTLHTEMGLLRGTVALREGDMLVIEASQGLSKREAERGTYRIGEGITGMVALEGKPRVIADVSKEKGFLNRTGARSGETNVAFICVPIIYMDDVIGTISIDRKTDENTDLDADLRLLEIIANIMADAVYAAYAEVEEREKLISENKRLHLELENKLRPTEIVGNCANMKKVYSMIFKVASSNATVLIRANRARAKSLWRAQSKKILLGKTSRLFP